MKVAMIDLLSTTPFYNRMLAEHLAPLIEDFTLYTTGYTYDPKYFDHVSFRHSPGLSDLVNRLQIRHRTVRRVAKLFEYSLNFLYVSHLIQHQHIDIAHIQWFILPEKLRYQISAVKRWQLAGIQVVGTVHNLVQHDMESNIANQAAYRDFYCTADHLIVHTQSDYNGLQQLYGIHANRISIIPMGPFPFRSKPSMLPPETYQRLGCRPDNVILLCPGGIRPYKGIEEVLISFSRIAFDYPSVRLVIAGNPLDLAYVKSMRALASRLHLDHLVRWELGFVPESDLAAFHSVADIVIFAYRNVSQSAAFLTAASAGAFVLGTDVGGIGEILQDGVNGAKALNNTPEILSQKLRECLELTRVRRNEMGSRLKMDVETNFGWPMVSIMTKEVYDHLLQPARF